MPTYPYACTACDHRFEAVQSFSDDALTVCPVCGGRLRKVFSSVGVVFKGSGFYRTDSRGSASSSTASSDSSSSTGGKDSGSSGGSDKPASTPAAAPSTPAGGSSTSSSGSSSGGSKGTTSAA